MAYTLDPNAENSDDEQRIKKTRKEAKLVKEEKKKQQKSKKRLFLGNRDPGFTSMLNDSTKGVCRRCGRPGHYARTFRAAIPPYRPGPPPAPQQQSGFPLGI